MASKYTQYLTISQVREEIAKITGRYDLVSIQDGYYCNNGIDLYIHQGQRSLERRLNVHPTYGKWWYSLTSGNFFCPLQNLRTVQECWVLTTTTRKKLIKIDHKYLAEEIQTKPFDNSDYFDEPKYYYPDKFRLGLPTDDTKIKCGL
jgi:hypothetical protein